MHHRFDHQDQVRAFLCRHLENTHWDLTLPQGRGHETYLARSSRHACFIKLGAHVQRYRIMASLGLAPEVLVDGHLEGGLSIMVQPYIRGRTPTRQDYRAHLDPFAKAIDRTHHSAEMQRILPQACSDRYDIVGLEALAHIRVKWNDYRALVPDIATYVDESLETLAEEAQSFSGLVPRMAGRFPGAYGGRGESSGIRELGRACGDVRLPSSQSRGYTIPHFPGGLVAKDNAVLDYYRQATAVTDPGKYREHLLDLPDDIPALCRVVQGLVIHDLWVTRYGIELHQDRLKELRLYFVERIIARAFELDERPLDQPRSPDKRVIGCCRDFSVLLCSILRAKGIPARARCGFGAYFGPGYCDHWICEYWHAGQARWISVDAQMDALQQDSLNIDFDVCDMPDAKFLVGGRAWRMCTEEGYDPALFGIGGEYRGLWFVRGNLLRDLASLNKEETVPYLVGRPWDAWPLVGQDDQAMGAEDLELLARVASVTQGGDQAFRHIRSMYEGNSGLQVPPRWLRDMQALWFSEQKPSMMVDRANP